MKIQKISLYNFRRFQGRVDVDFDAKLTVLAANNGAGKTSLLDAIAIAFGAFLTRLPKISGRTLSDQDICLQRIDREPLAAIMAETFAHDCHEPDASLINRTTLWQRLKSLEGRRKKSQPPDLFDDHAATLGLKQINALADYYIDHETTPLEFPILAYYGTGRAVLDIPQRRRGFGKEFPRFHAYADCLNPKTNFRKLFEHFYFLEDLERREKEAAKDWDYRNPQLEAIRQAVNLFLHGKYQNPHTALRPLRFLLDGADGMSYRIEQLSDGYKTSLAMVMDIASRAVEANPHLGVEALAASGIVLIDEIELHLHPSWQQRIIPDLQRTFPNIQFICTTHSPQVLSTVRPGSIRTIHEDGRIASPTCKTYGAESKRVLEELMHVDSRPPVLADEIREFMRITDRGDWGSARYQGLRAILMRELGETDPVLLDAEIKKNFQQLAVE